MGAAKYFISSSHRTNTGKITIIILLKLDINFNHMGCRIITLIELPAKVYGTVKDPEFRMRTLE